MNPPGCHFPLEAPSLEPGLPNSESGMVSSLLEVGEDVALPV
jgi:hypothetical protein